MNPVAVRHGAGDCAVFVRTGARDDLSALITDRLGGFRVAVISDTNVAKLAPLALDAPVFTFPAGEAAKTRATWSDLTDRLLEQRFDRRTVIVACGGGVTTDLAGFVAATYLRGVPWIAVPTSTLGMLDAAIGGKTGVDTAAGKNLVGAFHPPQFVVSDPAALASLPVRAYREGLAEAVKHAVTLDESYGTWMTANAAGIDARDNGVLEVLIRRSVELKGSVVADDEREGDRRAVLNAGHTVAHGLERASDYAIPHGEAVAIGLVLETRVAERVGICSAGTSERLVALLRAMNLPVAPPPIDRERFFASMGSDKKNRGGVIHAALPASFGTMARHDNSWTAPLDLAVLGELL